MRRTMAAWTSTISSNVSTLRVPAYEDVHDDVLVAARGLGRRKPVVVRADPGEQRERFRIGHLGAVDEDAVPHQAEPVVRAAHRCCDAAFRVREYVWIRPKCEVSGRVEDLRVVPAREAVHDRAGWARNVVAEGRA